MAKTQDGGDWSWADNYINDDFVFKDLVRDGTEKEFFRRVYEHSVYFNKKRYSSKNKLRIEAVNDFLNLCSSMESVRWLKTPPKKRYVDSFTPVILAGGRNRRFGQVPKVLQTVLGTSSIVRVIDQLKNAGFRENDIYVVTRLDSNAFYSRGHTRTPSYGINYSLEPFWFFYMGMGKRMGLKVRNITFSKPLGRSEVVKRFAEGTLEQLHYEGTPGYIGEIGWVYIKRRPRLKKNLLVLHADNVFHSDAPMSMFVSEGGRMLNDEQESYCIFEMFKNKDRTREPVMDIAGYAFDRQTYGDVAIPHGGRSISEYVCKKMEKNGHHGRTLKSRMTFSNINDKYLYNLALYRDVKSIGLSRVDGRVMRNMNEVKWASVAEAERWYKDIAP